MHYSIVGYATVYRFFRFPNKTRLRISQFIIFPPYQRQGHACYLLGCIYDRARRNNAVDVTLELQSKQFKIMRTMVDMHCMRQRGIFQFKKGQAVPPLTEFDFNKIREAVPLIDAQIVMCYYVFKWRVTDQTDNEAARALRLELKRYLYTSLPDELCGMSISERKSKLELLHFTLTAEIAILSSVYDKHADLCPLQ